MSRTTSRHFSIGAALVIAVLVGALSPAFAKGKPQPPSPLADVPTQIQIFGVWHCGNHFCDWNEEINMADFDQRNHWLIDRGDGKPSVNLVVLSFVNPLQLLYGSYIADRLPLGMTKDVVDYFKN
jgi:hypothetical protein